MWIAILKLNQRIERLEWERIIARQEIIHEGNGEEQLRLLKDIQSQLQMIQSGMRSLKTKEVTPKDDVSLASLQEAKYEMVYLPSPLTGEKLCPFHECLFL